MDYAGIDITWLGHATLRITLGDGTTCFIDPWLKGNPSCPDEFHQPERVDAVFLTHGHFDHFGDTADLVSAHQPAVFAIHEIAVHVEQALGAKNAVGLNKGGEVGAPGGIKGHLVDAVHSSGMSGDSGIIDGGAPGGWVLECPGGPTLYHAGDTALFGDMALIGEVYRPDVAFLPIGGHYTMGPEHAAKAAQMLGAATVVPIHWGTFPALAGTPGDLTTALAGSAVTVMEMEIGA